MKKINDKGFMLAEIIIVSAILATALVGLFATFSKIFIEYEKRSVYDSIDAIYFGRGIVKSDNIEELLDGVKTNCYKDISDTNILKKYQLVHSYVLKYDATSINKLLEDAEEDSSTIVLYEKYKEYLEYLKNNLDFNDIRYNYIVITELSDTCDSDGSNCKEDNANVSFGYYTFRND